MLALGQAMLLAGDVAGADEQLEETHEAGVATGATFAAVTAFAQRALLALDRSDLPAARSLSSRAHEVTDFERAREYMVLGLPLATQALIAVRDGDGATAERALAQGQQLRPDLSYALPWYSVQTLLVMAWAYLALDDVNGARAVLLDATEVLRHRPDLGVLVDEVARVRAGIEAAQQSASGWESSLTAAELRLLPFLTTHLTFREIGERLFVSRNTVKTQAISIYRKLGASSRGEAVQRAAELGLVGDTVAPPSRFIP
jgi:LuxR family maltose regulon positive regulatory protein